MKKILFSVSALMLSSIFAAEITLLSPLDTTVSLIKPAQQAFFDMPMQERREQYINKEIRSRWKKIGSEPVRVAFRWKSDLKNTAKQELVLTGKYGTEKFEVKGNFITVANLFADCQYHWYVAATDANGKEIRSATGKFVTASNHPRLISIPKVGNIRDLGNYTTKDGRKIRQGMIYRGRALNNVSPDRQTTPGKSRVNARGKAEIKRLGIKTDLDIRSRGETAGMTASPFGADTKWCRLNSHSYEHILKSNALKKCFAEIFRVFLDEKNYPVYVHCDGGRDRTGTICLLVLGALNADDDTIERDWQASALFFTDLKRQVFDKFIAGMKAIYGDRPIAEMATLYLKEIGITDQEIEKLKSIMLE